MKTWIMLALATQQFLTKTLIVVNSFHERYSFMLGVLELQKKNYLATAAMFYQHIYK